MSHQTPFESSESYAAFAMMLDASSSYLPGCDVLVLISRQTEEKEREYYSLQPSSQSSKLSSSQVSAVAESCRAILSPSDPVTLVAQNMEDVQESDDEAGMDNDKIEEIADISSVLSLECGVAEMLEVLDGTVNSGEDDFTELVNEIDSDSEPEQRGDKTARKNQSRIPSSSAPSAPDSPTQPRRPSRRNMRRAVILSDDESDSDTHPPELRPTRRNTRAVVLSDDEFNSDTNTPPVHISNVARPLRRKRPIATIVDSDSDEDDTVLQKKARQDNNTANSVSQASVGEPEKLVKTETMAKFRLSFNTRYYLFICELCAGGVRYEHLNTHLSEPTLKRYLPIPPFGTKSRTEREVPVPHMYRPPRNLKALLLNELRLELNNPALIEEELKTRPTETSLPYPYQVGPVLGLAVLQDCWACNLCPAASPYVASIHRHKSRKHRKAKFPHGLSSFYRTGICAQTFFRSGPKFYEVAGSEARDSGGSNVMEGLTDNPKKSAAVLLRERKAVMLGNTGSGLPDDFSRRNIHPAYFDLGIHAFLEKVDKQQALKSLDVLIHPGTSPSTALRRLRHIVGSTFDKDCEELSKINVGLGLIIMNCSPNSGCRPQKFAPPLLKATRAIYAATEAQLIWSIIQYLRQDDDSLSPYQLSQEQSETLTSLDFCLRQPAFDIAAATDAFYVAIDSIYAPKKTLSMARDPFISPLMVFCALKCIKPDGSWTPIAHMPHLFAKLQFAIRLRSFHLLHNSLHAAIDLQDQDPEHISPEVDNDWINNTARKYCRMYLEEQQISPFASLRYWMHTFTRVVMNTLRPVMVRWLSPNRLEVEGEEIDMDKYRAFLQSQMGRLEKMVKDNVLLGIALDDIGIDLRISKHMDTGDEVTVGYGVLTPELAQRSPGSGTVTMDNADSDRLFIQMVKEEALGLLVGTSGIIWDGSKSAVWLRDIHSAWGLFWCLYHVLAGQAGRTTEEDVLNITNTLGGRRHAFGEGESIAVISNYHKGAHNSNMYKHILRLLPYRLARIMLILVRIVRPIELSALLEFGRFNGKEQEVITTYQTALFATWGKRWDAKTGQQTRLLANWFLGGLGVRMGVRKYRHFAAAIAREYIKTPEVDALSVASDQQAAHERVTSDVNYAQSEVSRILPPSRRQLYLKVSTMWHEVHGFETFPAVKE